MMATMIVQPAKWIYTLGLPGSFLLSLTLLIILAIFLFLLGKEEERKGMGITVLVLAAGAVLPFLFYETGVLSFTAAAKAYRQVIGVFVMLVIACVGWGVEGKRKEN